MSFLFSVTVTFGMTSPHMYYYTKVMSELFLDSQFPDTKNTFRGLTTMHDFWRVCQTLILRSKMDFMKDEDKHLFRSRYQSRHYNLYMVRVEVFYLVNSWFSYVQSLKRVENVTFMKECLRDDCNRKLHHLLVHVFLLVFRRPPC